MDSIALDGITSDRRGGTSPLPKDCFAEILEPMAHLLLCQRPQTDKDYGNNREPDEQAKRSFDDGDQEKETEDRGEYQKYR